MRLWIFTFFICVSFPAPLFGQPTDVAPDALVRKVTEDTLTIMRSNKNIRNDNREKIIDLVEATMLPYFAFDRMTRLAMGNNWGLANSQQQLVLISEFRTLLVNTYALAFMSYKDKTVEIKPSRMAPGDTDVVVRTVVNQQNGQPPVTIDYYMGKTDNSWQIYDITIEGVRWVLNYRNTFNNDIQNNGIDGLIKALQNKNRSSTQ